MSLPLYSGIRTDGRPEVFVTRDGDRQPLCHLQRLSTTGLDWGVAGPASFDLARSVVGDYLGTQDPPDAYAKAVLSHLIQPAPEAGWTITSPELHEALRRARPLHGVALTLGRVAVTRPIDVQLAASLTGRSFIQLCLLRHELGDWGDVDNDGRAANAAALRNGGRILSEFPVPADCAIDAIPDANRIWIITEACDDDGQRHATTVLYPTAY